MYQRFSGKIPASLRVIWLSTLHWWDDLVIQAVMNLLFLLSWVTVILGPPVTFGIHYVESQYVRGDNLGLKGVWEGAKKYFVISWIWMLVNVVLLYLCIVNANFYLSIEAYWGAIGRYIVLVLGSAWFIIQFYAVPFLMIQEKPSLITAWRNGFMMTMASPLYLLILLLFLLVFGLFSFLLGLPMLLGYITLFIIIANQAVKDRLEVFREMAAQQKDASENEHHLPQSHGEGRR